MLKVGKAYKPTTGIEILKKIVMTAPTEAPDEIPNVYGSANGFLSKPWKAAPAMAREAPTSPAKSTRGRRIFQKILAAVSSTD